MDSIFLGRWAKSVNRFVSEVWHTHPRVSAPVGGLKHESYRYIRLNVLSLTAMYDAMELDRSVQDQVRQDFANMDEK